MIALRRFLDKQLLLYYKYCMGRPRNPNRMSRMIQARVTDPQYDWLIERAEGEDGDMSEAIRGAIDFARIFVELLRADDPPEALREFLRRSKEEQEAQLQDEAAEEAARSEEGSTTNS
jgi:hypothetical protein